ncbi:hypothetical protein KAR91_43700 [Candidatus Pacearchaeota archaeon]|nr:hypothetical protein [Candidatus Pacearchaeota archaeon]
MLPISPTNEKPDSGGGPALGEVRGGGGVIILMVVFYVVCHYHKYHKNSYAIN